MATTKPGVLTIDLAEFDDRLDDLIALVADSPETIEFSRNGEVTASVHWFDGRPMFDFYHHWWGRERDRVMGALALALTGEDLDEVETEVANAVAEVRWEIRQERAASGG